MNERYEILKAEILRRQAAGQLPERISADERADWAYGNAVIENDEVTREMAVKAVGLLATK